MSNFHPLFVPSELPSPLREQALKYAQYKAFSKVGAGDGTADKPKKLIQYGVVFMKSLRFKDVSTTKPEKLPFIPGIIPGVKSASPVPQQFLDADKGFRLVPLPPGPYGGAPGPASHFPYMRRFVPSQAGPCHAAAADMDAECHDHDHNDHDERDDQDLSANFATPPYAFGVPFRYPFPAFL